MKISLTFLLLLLGSALPSPLPNTLPNGDVLYPYGEAEGDQKNPKDDDGTSPKIPLTIPFTFFTKTYDSVHINNNGVISFAVPVSEYTPKGIPLKDGKAFVAPYWGDVNNKLGGEIYYRQSTDPALLNRITKDLNTYFPDVPFTATWALVATWDHVAYFGSASKKTNTFQGVLVTDGKMAFVILNYGDIQWTTGTASGGDPRTGLGGKPAQSGFNTGNDKDYYSIPGSRSPAIANIINTSNVEVNGRWVFRVDHFEVTGVSEELQKLIPPVEEEPEVPVQEEPQTPVEEQPEAPEEEEPQTPVEEEPKAPVEEEPKETQTEKEPEEIPMEEEPEEPMVDYEESDECEW